MKKRNAENNEWKPKAGYIKKYFGDDIDLLLSESDRVFRVDASPYVRHERAEEFLDAYRRPNWDTDRITLFTGLTGSGKSTILRNYFGFGIESHIKPKIDESTRTVLIPVDFNRSHKSAKDVILGNLGYAMELVQKRYDLKYPRPDNEDFYQYVDVVRPDLLRLAPNYTSLTHTERLNEAAIINNELLNSCRFQYVMEQAEELDHVLLLIDDVEMVGDPVEVVMQALQVVECFLGRDSDSRFMFDIILSCRHHVWRMMNERNMDDDPQKPRLQSYFTTDDFDLYDPVDIKAIVDRRQEIIRKRRANPERWDAAAQAVKTILFYAGNNVGTLVQELMLKNNRSSFGRLKELVKNPGLQIEPSIDMEPGSFHLDSVHDFDLSRVNLIRQFGLRNWTYYASDHSDIPNLLYNLPETDRKIELYPLLTLKYFLKLSGYTPQNWEVGYQVSHFMRRMKTVFGIKEDSVYDETFGRSVRYLIKNRMLLRSKDQDQIELEELRTEAGQRRVQLVYVSGAAHELWNELANSSALFQLFIDDIWLPNDSDYFEDEGNNIEHCVEYLTHLWEIEQRIYHKSGNIHHDDEYRRLFGKVPVCRWLLTGLKNSLQNIINSADVGTGERKRSAEITMERVKTLERSMPNWR